MGDKSNGSVYWSRTRFLYWVVLAFWWASVPALVMTGLEFGLRTIGYGVSTVPFRIVETEHGSVYRCDYNYPYKMFYLPSDHEHPEDEFHVPVKKNSDTYRIFVFGSSAAAGWPQQVSFTHILEILLTQHYPGVRFEIYNVSRNGLNSSAMRPLAQVYGQMAPDAYLIYMGNNEVIGPYGLRPYQIAQKHSVFRQPVWTPSKIRVHQYMRQFRLAQFADQIVTGSGILSLSDKPSAIVRYDDPRLPAVWRNFEYNLVAIFQTAKDAGAQVFISTLGANLRHYTPSPDLFWEDLSIHDKAMYDSLITEGNVFEDLQRWQDASNAYTKAERISGSSPYLFYRRANCYEAMEEYAIARDLYEKALEMDAFVPMRAKKAFNTAIRRAVAHYPGDNVTLVEGQSYFESVAPHNIPGEESFVDPCHFRIAGMYTLARAFHDQMALHLPDWVKTHEVDGFVLPKFKTILEILDCGEYLVKKCCAHNSAVDEGELKIEFEFIRHPSATYPIQQSCQSDQHDSRQPG